MGEGGETEWDDDLAQAMLGKTLLIGITYTSFEEDRHVQCYGEVISTDRARGIHVRLAGSREGEILWLPPDLGSVSAAEPGWYRLRSTEEVVEDPDYTVRWVVYPNENNESQP